MKKQHVMSVFFFILTREANQRDLESPLLVLHGACRIVTPRERYRPLSRPSGGQAAQHLKTGGKMSCL